MGYISLHGELCVCKVQECAQCCGWLTQKDSLGTTPHVCACVGSICEHVYVCEPWICDYVGGIYGVCVYVYMDFHDHVYVCMCVCVCTCTSVHMHTYTQRQEVEIDISCLSLLPLLYFWMKVSH